MLKLLGRNASQPAPSEPEISVTSAARASPKPAATSAIPDQPSPVIIERNAATDSSVRRDSGDSLFEELGALGGDVEWLSPNKPAVTNADILSIQDSSYVPQAPLLHSAPRRGSQCSTGGLPAPSGQGSAEGGGSPGDSDRYSPGSFLADPGPAATFPATNRKLFSTGGEDDQSWLVAAPGGSDFGSTQEFMADDSSPRLGGQRQQHLNPSPSRIPSAPFMSTGPTRIPKPAAGSASSAGGNLKKARISEPTPPQQQQPPERQQLARRYEQAPSFIPGAPEGYLPSSHGSMSSLAPSLAEAPASGEAADAAMPVTTAGGDAGGDAGGGGDFERSQSHDSFEEAERVAAQTELPSNSRGGTPPVAVTAAASARPIVAPPAVAATVAPPLVAAVGARPAVAATVAPPAVAAIRARPAAAAGSVPLTSSEKVSYSQAPVAVPTVQPNNEPAAAPTDSEPPSSFHEPNRTAGLSASERASDGVASTVTRKPAAAAADDKVKQRGCFCFKW